VQQLSALIELADRVFCIYSKQAPAKGRKAEAKMPGEQRTLEAYSGGDLEARGAIEPRPMVTLGPSSWRWLRRSWWRYSTPGPARWRR
jgi:hypothetical protein